MPDGFNVHVSGDAAYRAKLDAFEKLLVDLSGLWPLLVPIVNGWLSAQFATEGGWGGQQWQALSPAYALEKARTHPGRSILVRDGDLKRATSPMRREATPRTLTMWIDDPKAVWHQEGDESRGLPARPLIPDRLPPSAYRDIDLAGEEYVNVLVRQLGL